eukprot:12931963-Prorocentrum_lima.AAC.1
MYEQRAKRTLDDDKQHLLVNSGRFTRVALSSTTSPSTWRRSDIADWTLKQPTHSYLHWLVGVERKGTMKNERGAKRK